jgi:hypothetical protein
MQSIPSPEQPVKMEDLKNLTKEESLLIVQGMLQSLENLPPHGMLATLNNYDLQGILLLFSAILKTTPL